MPSQGKPRKTIDTRTGIIYPSLKAACSERGLNYEYSASKLKDQAVLYNDTFLEYLDRVLEKTPDSNPYVGRVSDISFDEMGQIRVTN